MKIKPLITEAMIDTLPLSKLDRGVLKMIHKGIPDPTLVGEVRDFLSELAKKIAVDMHLIVTLYMTYLKYKDFLFSEEGITKVSEYDTLSPELRAITREMIMYYIYDNYKDTVVFDVNGITATVEFMEEDVRYMIEEEMLPEVYITCPVKGTYSREPETREEGGSSDFNGTLFLDLVPSPKGYGFELLSFSEETFGDWMIEVEGRRFSDMVDTGYVKETFIKPLENYTEKELKRFADQWIAIMGRVIRRNVPLIEKYKDYVEHGGSMFENKKKRKTIK